MLITPGLKASEPANQSRARQSLPRAPRAAPSRNPAKVAAAVAAVLGLKTVEVQVTPNVVTRGTMACRPAKHAPGPRQPLHSSEASFNTQTLALLMVLAWQTPQQ